VAGLKDEILMAYADGLLDAQARSRVETVLQSDSESRRRVGIFHATGAPLAQLYQKPMHEPAPAHLVKFVLNYNADKPRRSASAARRTSFADILRKFSFESPFLQGAFATAAMVMVAAGAGWVLRGDIGGTGGENRLVAFQQGHIFAAGVLKNVLETLPSGEEARAVGPAGDTVTMRATLTFKNKAQSYCREYEIAAHGGGGGFAGLGCRDQSGNWDLQVHVSTKAVAASSNQVAPAGSATEAALETIVDRTIAGDALGKKDEAAVMGGGWK